MREDTYLQPLSPYGVTKLAAEHLCTLYHANYGVPTVSLRYFTVYGPRQRPDMAFHKFIRAAIAGQPISLYGDGEQTRDFTFVADIVAANRAAGDRGTPGAVYNIGGGSRVTINHVLELVAGLAGRPLDIRREEAQKGDMRDTFADTSRARADLGFKPSRNARVRAGGRVRSGSPRRWPSAWLSEERTHDFVVCVSSHGPPRVRRARRSRAERLRLSMKIPAVGEADADKFLFDRGTEFLAKKNWINAREYFRRIVDNYPRSAYREEAKLGIGDSFLGEGRIESLILGANEFKEFLTYFPRSPRTDYAQYRLGLRAVQADARTGARSDRHAGRDSGVAEVSRRPIRTANTVRRSSNCTGRRAIGCPNRSSRSDCSTTASAGIQGAFLRFSELLKTDPEYTKRDEVYFYLAETLTRMNLLAEALPMYDKLLKEFDNKSKYRAKAEKRSKRSSACSTVRLGRLPGSRVGRNRRDRGARGFDAIITLVCLA